MGPAAVPRFGHGGGPPESPHQPARRVPLILVGAVLGRAAAGSPLSLVSGAAAISSPLLGSCSDPSFPRVRCSPQRPLPAPAVDGPPFGTPRCPASDRSRAPTPSVTALVCSPAPFQSSAFFPPQGILFCASRYDRLFPASQPLRLPSSLPGLLIQMARQIVLRLFGSSKPASSSQFIISLFYVSHGSYSRRDRRWSPCRRVRPPALVWPRWPLEPRYLVRSW